jgi:hypothetical protein
VTATPGPSTPSPTSTASQADPGDPLLYSRDGHTVMAGDTVAVRVYCTRPLQVVPR